MKLTFLGTSAGKPTKERNVTALALKFEQESKWYLFDCGEATQHQILRSTLSIAKLDTIFITHLHGDHYYGLPGLLSSKKLDKAFDPLQIYGPKGIKEFLECFMDISKEHLGYELNIIEIEPQQRFVFEKFTLQILPLVHSVESFAYHIKEADKNAFGKRVIICGDNSEPDVLGEYLQDLDLLIHESTYTQKVYDTLPTKFLHTTAKKLAIAAQNRGVKNLIATHISPRYSKEGIYNIEMICDEIKHYYRGKCFVANDFDIYSLEKDSTVRKY